MLHIRCCQPLISSQPYLVMFSKYKIEIKWAFVFIAALLGWSLLEKVLGFHSSRIGQHEYISMGFMIPAILIYVLALREKKMKFYNGHMSFKQGFIAGLIITLIVSLFNPFTQWVISTLISPSYFDNIIAFSVEGGYDTLEEAQAYFNYSTYALQGTIWAFAMGVITSLIVALFIRSKT